jgi:UDP-GlcNAc:undecaprenyl-phosphate/decaprenyl-phosphate GlcNAc-1-phosphate transferase
LFKLQPDVYLPIIMIYPIVAFVLVFLTMPFFIRMAKRFNLYDVPDDARKIHVGKIPFTGGFGFVPAFMLVTACMFALNGSELLRGNRQSIGTMGLYIAEAGLIIFILGVVDDFKDLPFTRKFLFQFFAAFFLILGATKSDIFPRVFNAESSSVLINSLGTTISVLWFVGMTNAINMIDGMDGLAGTTTLTGALAMGILGLLFGNTILAFSLFILAGVLVAFLVYNMHPARVFMGDTGSMFLGFILGVSGWLLVDSLPIRFTSFIVPVVILGLPVADTLLAFFRRIVRRQNPFSADTFHIHHMLKRRFNLNPLSTVLILFAVNALCGTAGVFIALLPETAGWFILGAVAAGMLAFFHLLGYTRLIFPRQPEAVASLISVDTSEIGGKRNGSGTVHSTVKSDLGNK